MRGCSTRIAILLVVGTCMLLFMGATTTFEGMRYRDPVNVTYEQLLNQKPTAGWYNVSGGFLSVAESAHLYKEGTSSSADEATEIYVPLKDNRLLTKEMEQKDDTVHVIVETSDPQAVNQYKKLAAITNPDEAKKLPESELFIKKDISGMIQSSLRSVSEEEQKALRQAMPTIAEDCVFISDGARPSAAKGLGMLAGGAVLGVIGVFWFVMSRRA